jgi:hypothetical protein
VEPDDDPRDEAAERESVIATGSAGLPSFLTRPRYRAPDGVPPRGLPGVWIGALLGMVVAPFLTSLPALVPVALAIRARKEGHPHAPAALVTSVVCLLLATWFWLVLGPAFGSS